MSHCNHDYTQYETDPSYFEEICRLHETYKPFIKNLCCEYHRHSWEKGCYSSDNEQALIICRLIDEIDRLNGVAKRSADSDRQQMIRYRKLI